jgi:hypothetical protein
LAKNPLGLPPTPAGSVMAPRKKDKAKVAARKHKRAGKDVMREIYDMNPEAGGEVAVNNAGSEMTIHSTNLFSLPASLGTLEGLQFLNMSECPQLLELPHTIGGLKALTMLKLPGCTSLAALPAAIGELKALTTLYLMGCSSLTELPAAIGELGALTELWLTGCTSLTALPDSIGKLGALTRLNLAGCSSLVALPDAIGELGALTHLALGGCLSLEALPATIGALGALTELDLGECASLAALPATIGELGALTELNLHGCSSLTALPVAIGELGALTELWLTGCSSLVALPDAIGKLSALTLNLDEGSNLTIPPDSNSGLDKASYLMRLSDEADRGQPEEEHKAEVERKALEFLEFREDVVSLSDAQRLTLRRLRRRVCDACGRQGTLEVERFPVCWCGARRYCDEKCQQVDWDRGHSATCASGHTFPQSALDTMREIPLRPNKESLKVIRDWAYEMFPPPADRPR